MNCIFCKKNSDSSVSREHIIPESLGNIEHILPRGIVCDKCNHYFSIKVEKPILDSEYFIQRRVWNFLPNKKGRIPQISAIGLGVHLGISGTSDGGHTIYPVNEINIERFKQNLLTIKNPQIRFIVPPPIDTYLVSRFLAKIALEVLTHRIIGIDGWEQEVTFKKELDDIRNYARYGDPKRIWQYHERRIYDENHRFVAGHDVTYENILHEFTLLYTEEQELFAVIAILGIEYVINFGNPEIEAYREWLNKNQYKSPLYIDGLQ